MELIKSFLPATINHDWIVIGVAIFIIVLIVAALEKSRAMTALLVLYGFGLVASYIPFLMDRVSQTLPSADLNKIKIIFSLLPIVALLVYKYKNPRRR